MHYLRVTADSLDAVVVTPFPPGGRVAAVLPDTGRRQSAMLSLSTAAATTSHFQLFGDAEAGAVRLLGRLGHGTPDSRSHRVAGGARSTPPEARSMSESPLGKADIPGDGIPEM